MEKVTQFSIFLANKAGVLSKIFRELAKEKVNVTALAMMDAAEHGVLRMVTHDCDAARATLASLNLPVTETDCLAVTLSNRPGAVADICEKLAESHVNVNYLYCTTGAKGGKTVAVLKVPDIRKAIKTLDANNRTVGRDMKAKLRRPPAAGRR